MNEQNIHFATDDRGVATLILGRPGKHNAFDEHLISALTQTFQDVAADDSIRVLVLRAEGKNFCAGADLEWMKRMSTYSFDDNMRDATAMANMLKALNFLPQATIARVQGAALGGGSGLVCCCDMTVAASDASFAFSEARLGLIPSAISPYAVRAIGARAARRYFLTAERFHAARAMELGMVSEVVDEGKLDAAVDELIAEVLKCGPAAVRAAKQMLFRVSEDPFSDDMVRATSEGIARIRATEEGREGVAAFLEKRHPSWLRK